MESGITEQELIEELRAALENAGPEDAMTTGELAEIMGVSVGSIRKQLPALIEAGHFQVVRVRRKRWDGLPTTVSAVRLAT